MSTAGAISIAEQRALLAAARENDETAYQRLVEPHRRELLAHCYRMLGSLHDAEDALQDALLRAWRALGRFEPGGSLRAWLYRIATNTCLDLIKRRPKRVLPVEYAPPSDPTLGPGEPVVESVWIEPYPEELLGEEGYAAPEARYEQRESIELAFVAALQHLPPRQRAVLIMREVLGYSAQEVAELLETTTASVNSALQRARATLDGKLPDRTQQATLRELGDERVRELVERYVEAWVRQDVDAVIALLTEEAAFAMPPLRTWFRGHDSIRTFLAGYPLSGAWKWRPLRVRANGQEALAFYIWDPDAGAYLPFALNVLTFEGDRIGDVVAFVVRATDMPDPDDYARWPDRPADERRLEAAFARYGLPDRLDP